MIKIICIGKIKEKYFKDALLEYNKRLSKYTNIKVIELEDFDYHNPVLSIDKEANNILKHIDSKDYVISFVIDGKELDSLSFSKKLGKLMMDYGNVTFIIGGSYGLSEKIKGISNECISFSKLTFPHQLFRVIVLEQIYRSFKIMNNESYHK